MEAPNRPKDGLLGRGGGGGGLSPQPPLPVAELVLDLWWGGHKGSGLLHCHPPPPPRPPKLQRRG